MDAVFKFELGDEVKEVITGFQGVIMGRSQYLTGCNQYGLLSRKLDNNKPNNWVWFDEVRLVPTGKKKIEFSIEEPGFDGSYPHQH